MKKQVYGLTLFIGFVAVFFSYTIILSNLSYEKIMVEGEGDLIAYHGEDTPSAQFINGYLEINPVGARSLQLYSLFLVATTISWIFLIFLLFFATFLRSETKTAEQQFPQQFVHYSPLIFSKTAPRS